MRSAMLATVFLLGCSSPVATPPSPPSSTSPPTPAPVPDASAAAAPPFDASLPMGERAATLRLDGHADCRAGCEGVHPFGVAQGSPVALWSEDLEKVAERFERDERVDVYGLVIGGTAVLYDHVDGGEHEVPTWHAFHAPGGGVNVTSGVPAPRVVFAVVSDGEPPASLGSPSRGWNERPGELSFVDVAATPDLAWAGGKVHARIAFERGRASFGLLLAAPEAPVPLHEHASSWEVVGLLQAHGRSLQGADEASAKASDGQLLTSSAVAAVPPGRWHGWAPAGDQPMLAVQLYTPPGPEQRFKQMAAAR